VSELSYTLNKAIEFVNGGNRSLSPDDVELLIDTIHKKDTLINTLDRENTRLTDALKKQEDFNSALAREKMLRGIEITELEKTLRDGKETKHLKKVRRERKAATGKFKRMLGYGS